MVPDAAGVNWVRRERDISQRQQQVQRPEQEREKNRDKAARDSQHAWRSKWSKVSLGRWARARPPGTWQGKGIHCEAQSNRKVPEGSDHWDVSNHNQLPQKHYSSFVVEHE